MLVGIVAYEIVMSQREIEATPSYDVCMLSRSQMIAGDRVDLLSLAALGAVLQVTVFYAGDNKVVAWLRSALENTVDGLVNRARRLWSSTPTSSQGDAAPD